MSNPGCPSFRAVLLQTTSAPPVVPNVGQVADTMYGVMTARPRPPVLGQPCGYRPYRTVAPGPGGPGRRVLVTFGSRHGATREIAAALVRSLAQSDAGRRGGLSAVLVPVDLRPDPAGFDAVVLGSAVYDGRWLEPARRYVAAMAPDLRGRSTWLFSSGVVGDGPGSPDDHEDAPWIGDSIGARGHRLFPGRVERRVLSAAERHVWATGADVAGDFRDWGVIRAWSEEIAAELASRPAVPVLR
jgi:menaquinone-dependent protoporphyrinogen oxidase